MAYIDTDYMPLHMPVPGTKEPAQIALLNENCVVLSTHDHATGKGVPVSVLRSGLAANLPSPGKAGQVYFATDTGQFYVDTGTSWSNFLTSGGSSTITGWTLIDPIIRDTINFGPEGGAGIDGSLTRIAADTFRFSGSLGLNGSPPAGINASYEMLLIGVQAALRGHATAQEVGLLTNSYPDAAGKNLSIVAGSGTLLSTGSNGHLFFYAAPSAPAGSEQNFQERFQVNAETDGTNLSVTARTKDGGSGIQWFAGIPKVGAVEASVSPRWTLTQSGDASTAPLILYSHGLDGVTFRERCRWNMQTGAMSLQGESGPVLVMTRTAPTTQISRIHFTGGAQGYDACLQRVANDDELRMAFSNNGTTWVDAVRVTSLAQGGRVILGDDSGGGNPAQQRYIKLAYNSSSGASGATLCMEMAAPNPNTMGYDFHVANVAKWGGLYFLGGAQTLRLGQDIGWGAPPAVQIMAGGSGILLQTGGNVTMNAGGQYFIVAPDGGINLGHPTGKWGTVFAVAGAINTSHVSAKEEFSRLDNAACADAVLTTDWLSFAYKNTLLAQSPPTPTPPLDGETEEMAETREAQNATNLRLYEEGVAAQEMARHQKGYVLGSDDYATADLFGQSDRKSANVNSDLAVVACALQDALRRIAALEGTSATAS